MPTTDTISLQSPNRLDRVIQRRESESPESYQRSLIDPLDILTPRGRQHQRQQDVESFNALRSTNNKLEAVELMSDKLYLDFIDGIPLGKEPGLTAKLASEIGTSSGVGSLVKWATDMRILDLLSLSSADRFRRSLMTRTDEVALEAASKTVIDGGVSLMKQMIDGFNETKDGALDRKKLVGTIFEVFCVTENRRRMYEREEYTDRIILSSTQYEDAPSLVFDQNHNFDALVLGMDGLVEELLQFKAGASDKTYDQRITTVNGEHYSNFLYNPNQYFRAIRLLTENSAHTSPRAMTEAKISLESILPRKPRSPLGHAVVASAFGSI